MPLKKNPNLKNNLSMNNQNNLKVVLYARVSSKEQEQEGYSIPAQLKLLQDYAQKNALNVVRIFEDVETAKQAGRTYFNEMVKFLQDSPDTKIILVEKTDRLYRNFRDYVAIDDLINNLKMEIHLVKEGEVLGKDSKSHQKFIHGIKVLMAKNYIDNLSEETKKGKMEKAEQGIFPSAAPIGYKNVEKVTDGQKVKTVDIDGTKAPIIRKMFERYATGHYSLSQIVDLVASEGLISKNGLKLGISNVESILKNPFYYGYFRWGSKLYKGNHEPIISRELFDMVQKAFRGYKRPQGNKHNFAFTGLLTCGKCGCAITAEIKKGKYIYYHCTEYKGKCSNSYIREEALGEKLGELVKGIQIDTKDIEDIKEALLSSHQDEKEYHDRQISSLNAQYTKLQNRIDQIYIDKLDGKVSEEFYAEKIKEWRAEQENIRLNIGNHENANTNYFSQGVHILELAQKAYSLYLKQEPAEKHRLLNYLLSNCTFIDGSLYPVYRKPFDLLSKRASCLIGGDFIESFRNWCLSAEAQIMLQELPFLVA